MGVSPYSICVVPAVVCRTFICCFLRWVPSPKIIIARGDRECQYTFGWFFCEMWLFLLKHLTKYVDYVMILSGYRLLARVAKRWRLLPSFIGEVKISFCLPQCFTWGRWCTWLHGSSFSRFWRWSSISLCWSFASIITIKKRNNRPQPASLGDYFF